MFYYRHLLLSSSGITVLEARATGLLLTATREGRCGFLMPSHAPGLEVPDLVLWLPDNDLDDGAFIYCEWTSA